MDRIPYAAAFLWAAVCCVLTFAECLPSARNVPLDEARLVRGGCTKQGATTMTDCVVPTTYCAGSGDTIFCSAQTCMVCPGGSNWPPILSINGPYDETTQPVTCPVGTWFGTCDAPASGVGSCSCSLPTGSPIPCGQYQQNTYNTAEGVLTQRSVPGGVYCAASSNKTRSMLAVNR